jgi:5-methylcytosine-specific restriction endonuclease McrA
LDGGTYEKFDDREIFERDRWRCGLCRNRVNPNLVFPDPMSASLDHIVPITKGGRHVRVNVQLAHLVCNVGKGNSYAPAGEQLLLIG